MKKIMVIGTIILFMGSIYSIPGLNIEHPIPFDGKTLYVGGSGPGNYSKIQDAIDNASDGDTVFVYNGAYSEAIQVNVEKLTVIGEDRDSTVIDANASNKAVVIQQNGVVISGFTVIAKNNCIFVTGGLTAITISKNNLSQRTNILYGIDFEYDGDNNANIIEGNIFYSNSCGIGLASWYHSGMNIIQNNTFINNFNGMEISGENNKILNNKFIDCRDSGITLYCGTSIIEENIFSGNNIGLDVRGSQNKIMRNRFENNTLGVRVDGGTNTVVTQNNFIHNEKHATFYEESRSHGNSWDNNFWTALFYPFGHMLIFGKINTGIQRILQFNPDKISYFYIRWMNTDSHPAQDPFDIEV